MLNVEICANSKNAVIKAGVHSVRVNQMGVLSIRHQTNITIVPNANLMPATAMGGSESTLYTTATELPPHKATTSKVRTKAVPRTGCVRDVDSSVADTMWQSVEKPAVTHKGVLGNQISFN